MMSWCDASLHRLEVGFRGTEFQEEVEAYGYVPLVVGDEEAHNLFLLVAFALDV